MSVRRLLLVVVCAPCVFGATGWAQGAGRISGSVVDATGAAVPGAEVRLFLPGGASPVLATATSAAGVFAITGVRPDFYDLAIEVKGFRTYKERIKVDPGRELSLPEIKLEVQAVAETVEVSAASTTVQTSNAEVSTTITNTQVANLPLMNRSPLSLLYGQAGVNYSADTTVINGQRTTYSNVTLDGINIQDNFIRTNALDFLPNLLLLDQVAEFTISTSNTNSAASGGASQLTFVTPSGGNAFHGKGFWYNRNSAYAANTWFNNQSGVKRPLLNQNQLGGSLGGPIKKDKLLFYLNYEAFRLHQQTASTRTILTSDARQGIYTYSSGGAVRKVNVLQAAGVQMDSVMKGILDQVPTPDKINNYRTGDSSESLLRNTAGYAFTKRNNRIRDNGTAKIDYNLSVKHVFTGSLVFNRDTLDRPGTDVDNDYSVMPKVSNDETTKLLSVGWRWSPKPNLTNELRGGFNLAPAVFNTTEKFGQYILTGMSYSNPLNTFRAQGRFTNTYSLSDSANWVHGKHAVAFGFQTQHIRVQPYNDAGNIAVYTIGMGSGNQGLTSAQLAGISSSDLAAANTLLATLGGYYTSYSQTFNVTSRSSGFVNGASDVRNLLNNTYAGYVQDTWKVLRRVTLNLGLRYDLYGRVDERDSLYLLPIIQNGNAITTLMSNSTLDFAGGSAGRPWYNLDRNNFAPNVGLSWDLFGDGKMAVRAGYSINYVNDENITTLRNSVTTNSGISASSTRSGLSGRVAGGLTPVVVPTFKVPRTFAENYALSSTSAFGMPDPNLRTPYVQQWSLGIQRQVKDVLVEVRYVANHATKTFRAFDFNQVIVKENGFLDDFLRAQKNGYLAQAATGSFNPNYNATIPGSQPLTIFPRLVEGGRLTNSTILTYLQQGQVGELANNYQTNLLNGPINFYSNPYALGCNFVTNYSNSSYNSLQAEVTRRMPRRGLIFQANYTYSKVLSDSLGDTQTNFEAFLDKNNPKIERARAPFDLTHMIKGNAVYQLPMGEGHLVSFRPLNKLLGGWSTSGILTWQSGSVFSVLSARGTLNRSARSTYNTANTTLNKQQLDELFQFRMTGNGPYFVNASAIGSDGRAVAADGAAPFSGQVFFQPGAGTLGALQRRMFSGPWTFNLDFTILKNTKIRERQSVDIRMDASNIFNHPTFYLGDQTITSTNFGRITSTFFGRRLIQFGMYYRF